MIFLKPLFPILKISFRIEFSALAIAHKAVNVGQGFIDYAPPDYFIEFYKETLNDPNILLHQYTRGFVCLRISFIFIKIKLVNLKLGSSSIG